MSSSRRKHLSRRTLRIEELESRQLLAGDLCGTHNLVENCSFEEAAPPASAPTNEDVFHVLPSGSKAIQGWRVLNHPDDANGTVDWVARTGFAAALGELSVDLSGSPGRGGIETSLDTIPGVRYFVSFQMAGNPVGQLHPNGSDPLKILRVSAADQSEDFSFRVPADADAANPGWQSKQWSFVARDKVTTLSFLALGPDPRVDNDPNDNADFGPAVDQVLVTQGTTALLKGVKFEDLDGDGVKDAEEPGLNGWRIHLFNTETGELFFTDTGTIDGVAGAYQFEDVPPGQYRLHELPQLGWRATAPGDIAIGDVGTFGFYDRNILPGQEFVDLNFGNAALGSIHGQKFNDLNTNGQFDEGIDMPLPGVTFTLAGTTGIGEEVTLSTVTDGRGEFSFVDLMPSVADEGQGSSYTVSEVLVPNYYATTPSSVTTNLLSRQELVAREGQADLPPATITVNTPSKLRGDRGDAERMSQLFPANVKAGAYEVTLTTSDFGPEHGSQGQQNEQSYVEGYDINGTLVFRSAPIRDLPDNLNQISEVVDKRVVINGDIASIKAFHISALVPGLVGQANSIDPVSVTFRNLDPREEFRKGPELQFGNARTARVSGFKFEDINGNGTRDDGEPGLKGWTIYVDQDRDGEFDPQIDTKFDETNALGKYAIDGLEAGTQLLAEVPQAGWRPTAPADGIYEVTVGAGQKIDGLDFGNQRVRGTIGGSKFFDSNGDGQQDNGEPAMAGVVIFIDTDGNGVRGFDESFVETDDNGHFAFNELAAGNYIIAEEAPRGFTQSFPANGGAHVVELEAGQVVSGLLFGNKEATNFGNTQLGDVHGIKYEDIDGDGSRDPGEPGVAGITVYFDVNGNGALDEGDYSTVTTTDDPETEEDETGHFWMEQVRPGEYSLREELPKGWFSTTLGPDGLAIVVRPGESVTGVEIGNARYASIHGKKFNDLNGNGTQDQGEPNVAGAFIFADLNQNGLYDGAGEPAAFTTQNGEYWLENLEPGAYSILEVLPADVVQTFPGGDLQGYEITLVSGQVATKLDFGNAHVCFVDGWKWDDQDQDGVIDPDEPGLAGFTIYVDLNRNAEFDDGEPFAVSGDDDSNTPRDEAGYWRIDALAPGEYHLREVQQPGWVQTFPDGLHVVTLENCGDIPPVIIAAGPQPIKLADSQVAEPTAGLEDTAGGQGDDGQANLPGDVTSVNDRLAAESALLRAAGSTANMSNSVNPMVQLADGELQIVGTEGMDRVRVLRRGDQILVKTNFLPDQTFDSAAVNSVDIDVAGGDDDVIIQKKIIVPSHIQLGQGDDRLRGGGGNDVVYAGAGDDDLATGMGHDIILGEAGNDRIYGGRGHDLLVGGTGLDELRAQRGRDIIAGGSNASNPARLQQALAELMTERSYEDRVAAVDQIFTIVDDEEEDSSFGETGLDLFYDGLSDAISMKKVKELG